MTKNIAVIRGDGIGPEIVQQALRVLDRVAALYGHTFQYTDVDMGGCAIDKWGDPLPQEMLEKCLQSDSVLLGAVGGERLHVQFSTVDGAVEIAVVGDGKGVPREEAESEIARYVLRSLADEVEIEENGAGQIGSIRMKKRLSGGA